MTRKNQQKRKPLTAFDQLQDKERKRHKVTSVVGELTHCRGEGNRCRGFTPVVAGSCECRGHMCEHMCSEQKKCCRVVVVVVVAVVVVAGLFNYRVISS